MEMGKNDAVDDMDDTVACLDIRVNDSGVNQYTTASESLKKDVRTASVGPIASNP